MRNVSLARATALAFTTLALAPSALASDAIRPIDDSLAQGAHLADAPAAPWHPSSLDVAVEGSLGMGTIGGHAELTTDLAAIARVGIGAFGIAATSSLNPFSLSASEGGSLLGGLRVPLGRYFVASALGEVGLRQRTVSDGVIPALFGQTPTFANAILPYVGTRTSITLRTPGTLGFELGVTVLAGDDVGRAQGTILGTSAPIGGFTLAAMAHVGIAIDGGQTF
jgi:hypothetical protein